MKRLDFAQNIMVYLPWRTHTYTDTHTRTHTQPHIQASTHMHTHPDTHTHSPHIPSDILLSEKAVPKPGGS